MEGAVMFTRLLPLLGALFVVGYVPTAAVYTARFFLDYAPVDANFSILTFPAATILPITVSVLLASMEMFSFRLAVLFWRAVGRARLAAIISIGLFAVLQALPVGSMYLGTRAVAYDLLVRSNEALEDKLRVARLQDQQQQRVVLGAGADDLTRLERLRDNLSSEIEAIRARRARLLGVPTRSRSIETQSEIERITRELDTQTAAKNELDQQILTRSADRGTLDREATAASGIVGSPTFAEFLSERFWSFDALTALVLSSVFPFAALAFGYINLNAMPNLTPPVTFDLRRELEIGAARPEADHPAFAELLKSALTAYILALRTGGDLADEAAILRLLDGRELDMLKGFADLKNQIEESRLSVEAKKDLITHVDRLQTEGFHHRRQPQGRAA